MFAFFHFSVFFLLLCFINKFSSLAVASALSWHSKRNRAFTDQYGKIVFRAEPNLKVDNCWYDSALSPYEQLHTNVTTWTFMSTSIGLDFPFYWADSQFGSNPVRILVIARNTSNPNSAPYLWPLSTTMQSEVTYAPGQLFMQLGCRRESMRWNSPVLDGGFVNTRVAFTLMYEATTGQQRLDAASELRLEKQLNSSIDAMRDICLPFYCIYGLQGPVRESSRSRASLLTVCACPDANSRLCVQRHHDGRRGPCATPIPPSTSAERAL